MKIFYILFLILFTSSSSFAQYSLEKIWESDSTTLKGPESATYDPKTNIVYVSSMNNGTIVKMDLNGKFIKPDWITGLTSNKGLGFYKGFLYTAETAAVAVIDIEKGTIIKRIPIEGAVMLNDLEVDANGNVYVTDTRTGKVYRIENDKPTLYLENIAGANGLMAVGSDLYVAGSKTFQKIDAQKKLTTIGEGYEMGLDGIVLLSKNEFILSNYRGMIYYVNANGTKQVLLDSRDKKIMANDISFNPTTRTLYVPSFGTNRVIAYRVK